MVECRRLMMFAAASLAATGCGRESGPVADGTANGAAAAPAAPAGPGAPAAPAAAEVVFDEGGLRVGGGDLRFGASQDEALARLASRGRPSVETNSECGSGPTQIARFPDGLALLFQDGRFGGWAAGPAAAPSARTTRGIGIGASRAELARAYPGIGIEESTLGTEFAAGAIGGLLDGPGEQARVATLWAGLTCNFR